MFKYLRNLNNSSHPTEVFSYIGVAYDEFTPPIEVGDLISIICGEVCSNFEPTNPLYLALSSKKEGETKIIKCIRLPSGTVLEGDVKSDLASSEVAPGCLCGAYIDPNRNMGVSITSEGEHIFEVIDNSNFNAGKISVVVI